MTAKTMKTLELHDQMIQFLIIHVIKGDVKAVGRGTSVLGYGDIKC